MRCKFFQFKFVKTSFLIFVFKNFKYIYIILFASFLWPAEILTRYRLYLQLSVFTSDWKYLEVLRSNTSCSNQVWTVYWTTPKLKCFSTLLICLPLLSGMIISIIRYTSPIEAGCAPETPTIWVVSDQMFTYQSIGLHIHLATTRQMEVV